MVFGTMMIENMFFVPIINLKVCNWQEKKKKLLKLYDETSPNIQLHGEDRQIYTNYFKDCFEIKSEVQYILYEEIKSLCGYILQKNFLVTGAWFQKTEKSGFHPIHNHGPIGYSSVCFINYNKKLHAPTHFIAPFLNFFDGTTLYYTPENIEEGSIIFFPSSINHYTNPNSINDERLILSFNLEFN